MSMESAATTVRSNSDVFRSDQGIKPADAINGPVQWFALRAFWNKTEVLMREAKRAGYQTYYAVRLIDSIEDDELKYKEEPLVSSLFFIKCHLSWLVDFKHKHMHQFMIYTDAAGGNPAPIRDEEMAMFILVTSARNDRNSDVMLLEPKPQYSQGDRVRVIDGIYKGATGIVRRIRRDRKLLVAVSGVAVVAISHIPPCYLEKIDKA